METRSRAHFPALSSRLPIRSVEILRFAPEFQTRLQCDVEGQDLVAM